VSCVDLTDDELWRVIAENTNAMSAAIHQQMELGEKTGETDDPDRAHQMRSRLEAISRYQREYRDCTAELRRRHRIIEAGGQRIVAASAMKILSRASVNDIFGSAN
jgi:DNA repair ATPase RecN